MSYAKLYNSLFASSIMDEGPVVTAVWAVILSQKDKCGVISLSPRSLAKAWRMDNPKGVAEVQKAWDVIAAPDPNSTNKAHDGRRIIPLDDGRWKVVSHEKYETLDKDRERLVEDANRKAASRRAKKAAAGMCAKKGCKRPRAGGVDYCSEHVFEIDEDERDEEDDA